MRGISWLAAEPVSFSRRTLLHGVSNWQGQQPYPRKRTWYFCLWRYAFSAVLAWYKFTYRLEKRTPSVCWAGRVCSSETCLSKLHGVTSHKTACSCSPLWEPTVSVKFPSIVTGAVAVRAAGVGVGSKRMNVQCVVAAQDKCLLLMDANG